ncbi:hypothetical protein BGK67_00635 [Streptomyces subrutilus]|uniref:Uncharacterized protein n=1 Tax=Streptomyces subrutilus TaxID=36818 RepID=A0A1E5PKI1_9ACTN|nr:hypothetical protein BGK67_00635 [Streptomyces subrutilus]
MRAVFCSEALAFVVCRYVRWGEAILWTWSAVATFSTPSTRSTSPRRSFEDPAGFVSRFPAISSTPSTRATSRIGLP